MRSIQSLSLATAIVVCFCLLHSAVSSKSLQNQVVAAVSDADAAPDTSTADQRALDVLTRSFREVAKQTLPAVVSIRTMTKISGMTKSSVPDEFSGDPFRDHPFFRDFYC